MDFTLPHSTRGPSLFALGLSVLLAGVFLLSGCGTTPVSNASDLPVDPATQACFHPESGIVFPKCVALQDRVSVTCGAPGRGCVTAYYTKTKVPVPSPALSYYLNSHVSVIPASASPAEKLIEQYIGACADKAHFTREEYRGKRVFGKEQAQCAQCTFDRSAWNDRATLKVVVVPRGKYLVCFQFLISAVYEQEWQGSIDAFVEEILAQSGKPQA